MNWFALTLLAVTFIAVSIWSVAVLFVRNRFRLRHRVDPAIATGVPRTWIADPRTPARVHRRIARAGHIAGAIATQHRPTRRRDRRAEPPAIVVLANDLRAHAVLLDRRLGAIAILAPPMRRNHLAALTTEVTALEAAAATLLQLDIDRHRPVLLATDATTAATDIQARTERLASALAELDALDHAAGLSSPLPPATHAPAPPVQRRHAPR